MSNKLVYGIDVGGTGIKGAVVDVVSGKLMTERLKIKTPKPATPELVLDVIEELISMHNWDGPIGCGFPAVIDQQICRTATNISDDWIGKNVAQLISERVNQQVIAINDADAAGLCERMYGAARGLDGAILMLTIGTGIGSALIKDDVMISNLEFGAMFLSNGLHAERYVSNAVRKKEDLSWKQFGKRLNKVLNYYCALINPQHVLLGGGIVKDYSEFRDYLDKKEIVTIAEYGNAAGCIGAAVAYHLQAEQ